MKTHFLGRLVQEPTLKYLQSGNPVLNLRVATNVGYGENKKTLFVSVAVWGKRAEALSGLLTRGGEYLFDVTLTDVKEFLRKDGSPGAELAFVLQDLSFTHGGNSPSERKDFETEAPVEPDWLGEIPF